MLEHDVISKVQELISEFTPQSEENQKDEIVGQSETYKDISSDEEESNSSSKSTPNLKTPPPISRIRSINEKAALSPKSTVKFSRTKKISYGTLYTKYQNATKKNNQRIVWKRSTNLFSRFVPQNITFSEEKKHSISVTKENFAKFIVNLCHEFQIKKELSPNQVRLNDEQDVLSWSMIIHEYLLSALDETNPTAGVKEFNTFINEIQTTLDTKHSYERYKIKLT